METSSTPLIRPERAPAPGRFVSRRRQWILWFVIGFGAMLGALSNGCSSAGSARSNRAANDALPVDSGVGTTSSSPGRTPYGENSGTQSYPVGRAKQSLAPKPSPTASHAPRLETL